MTNHRKTEQFTKHQQLLGWFQPFSSVFVAFSGGVDSAVLAQAAFQSLGLRALAFYIESPTAPSGEREHVEKTAKIIGIPLTIILGEEFSNADFLKNDPQRCYHCKLVRFSQLQRMLPDDITTVSVEGSNADDLHVYRPGKKAAEELGVRAPLAELGITKEEVRNIAKMWNLPTWDRPSEPCLASRIDYGIEIDHALIEKIKKAEDFLKKQDFSPIRVRFHTGNLVRVEVSPIQMPRFFEEPFRCSLLNFFHELDFRFVTLDLTGFRSGSLDQ